MKIYRGSTLLSDTGDFVPWAAVPEDNGDGTVTLPTALAVDNGDGTISLAGPEGLVGIDGYTKAGADATFETQARAVAMYGSIVNVHAHGVTGDGTTDDTAAINALIAASPAGTHLVFPRGEYRVTSTIQLKRDVHIHGTGCSTTIQDIAELEGGEATFIGVPREAPYLVGTVFRMDTAATDAMRFDGPGSANLYSFGIRFNNAFMLQNTGHGIVGLPTPASGSFGTGLWGSTWEDLWVFGHDGNHYAWVVTNGIYNKCDHLNSFGGGGLKLINDSPAAGNYGNFVCPNMTVQLFATGTAHCVHLVNVTSQLNFLLWGRLQCMVYDRSSVFTTAGVPNAAVQKVFYASGAGVIEIVRIDQPDFESNVGAALDWGIIRSTSHGPGYFGGLSTSVNNGNFWRGRTRSTPLVARSTDSVVPTTGVNSQGTGTGGQVSAASTNDMRGRFDVQTGTGCVAGIIATITFAREFPDNTAPSVVVSPANAATASKGLYVTNVTTTGFQIGVATALADSQAMGTYKVAWHAIG